MVITFDPKKDKLNQRKHGISLSAAVDFDWDNAMIWIDQRYHYSEVRECDRFDWPSFISCDLR